MRFPGQIFFAALMMCVSAASAQTATNTPAVNPAVQGALKGAVQARELAFFLIPPTADARASAELAQTNALTQLGLNCRVYALHLRRVDVSGCPDDFQVAWNGFITALENYRSADAENERSVVLTAEQAANALLVNPAEIAAASTNEVREVVGGNDIHVALQNLEAGFRKYGLEQIPAPK